MVIDEAASIPVNRVKKLILGGDYPSFISSTVHGYEGTGRSLSLKLLKTLKAGSSGVDLSSKKKNKKRKGRVIPKIFRTVRELKMEIPIRYGIGDK